MLGDLVKKFAQDNRLGDCGDLGLPGCDIAERQGMGSIDGILSVVFLVTGFLSVVFIVIGGFRYVISAGDPNGAKQAKDTILYAIIGLFISSIAWGIVQFIAGSV